MGRTDVDRRNLHPPAQRLIGEKAHRLYFIAVESVDYIESAGNYVTIYVGDDRYIARNSIKHLEAALRALNFVRIE
jgi:two-component system LytT family response regulator